MGDIFRASAEAEDVNNVSVVASWCVSQERDEDWRTGEGSGESAATGRAWPGFWAASVEYIDDEPQPNCTSLIGYPDGVESSFGGFDFGCIGGRSLGCRGSGGREEQSQEKGMSLWNIIQ